MTEAQRKHESKRNWEYMREDWLLRPGNLRRKREQEQLSRSRDKLQQAPVQAVQHTGPAAFAAWLCQFSDVKKYKLLFFVPFL